MAKKRSTTTKSTKSRARATTAATGAKRRTKSDGKAKSKPAATGANPRQPGRETKPKRVGLLDAATQILAKAKEPMACKAIVEQVVSQKLWSTKGKTPHATLYAAMTREIAKKGKDARFKKTGRGRFTLKS